MSERAHMAFTDQVGEWCAVLETLIDGESYHSYRRKKLQEIAGFLRANRYKLDRLAAADPEGEPCETCGGTERVNVTVWAKHRTEYCREQPCPDCGTPDESEGAGECGACGEMIPAGVSDEEHECAVPTARVAQPDEETEGVGAPQVRPAVAGSSDERDEPRRPSPSFRAIGNDCWRNEPTRMRW